GREVIGLFGRMGGLLRDGLQGAKASLRPVIRREPFGNTCRQEHFDFAKLLDNTCLHCQSMDLISSKYLASFRATPIALRHPPKRRRSKMSQSTSRLRAPANAGMIAQSLNLT